MKYVDVFRIASQDRWQPRTGDWMSQLRFADFVALSVLLNSLATVTTATTSTLPRPQLKARTLYKAVNKMCISLNSLSERRLADGSVRWPALHIWRPIKMHFAKQFLPRSQPPPLLHHSSSPYRVFDWSSLNCSFVCLICSWR